MSEKRIPASSVEDVHLEIKIEHNGKSITLKRPGFDVEANFCNLLRQRALDYNFSVASGRPGLLEMMITVLQRDAAKGEYDVGSNTYYGALKTQSGVREFGYFLFKQSDPTFNREEYEKWWEDKKARMDESGKIIPSCRDKIVNAVLELNSETPPTPPLPQAKGEGDNTSATSKSAQS